MHVSFKKDLSRTEEDSDVLYMHMVKNIFDTHTQKRKNTMDIVAFWTLS